MLEKKYRYKLYRVCPVCNYCWTEIIEGMPDLWSKQDCPMDASIACGGKAPTYMAEQIDALLGEEENDASSIL